MDLKRKAIRVGIAASLCMLVSNLLKLKFPFFVILPAVMPISTFFGETIKFGVNRIIGSFIGAVVGVIFATIQTENVIFVGLGVIVIVYICNYLKWDSTTSIACLVFASIMVGLKGSSAWIYSIHRLFDTFIGIVITTTVNNYVFNPDVVNLLKKEAKHVQESLLDLISSENFYKNKDELDNIEHEIDNIKNKFKIYTEEFKLKKSSVLAISKFKDILSIITVIFEHLKIINYISTHEDENNSDISAVPDVKHNNNRPNRANIDLIVNFHKNEILNKMGDLNKAMNDIA